MEKHLINTFIILFALIEVFTVTVSANSSWFWISETRPIDILPFVILGTLLIEITAIIFIPKTNKRIMTALIVTAANAASFVLPYLILLINPEPYPPFEWSIFDRAPNYIVGLGFLFLTLAAEVPIVFFTLRKNVKNRKVLLFTIIGINFLTTSGVAIVERTLCYGKW